MAIIRIKKKLAAVARNYREGSPKKNQSRNSAVSRINEEYITQVLEEIENTATKKLSPQFSRTESRLLGALSIADKFRLNTQVRMQSGTVPGTSRNMNVQNQEPTEDYSQNDSRPAVDASVYWSAQFMDSDPEEISYNGI